MSKLKTTPGTWTEVGTGWPRVRTTTWPVGRVAVSGPRPSAADRSPYMVGLNRRPSPVPRGSAANCPAPGAAASAMVGGAAGGASPGAGGAGKLSGAVGGQGPARGGHGVTGGPGTPGPAAHRRPGQPLSP